MAIKIQKCTSKTNTTYFANRPIKWIFVHYTAGTSSAKGVAKGVAKYFANPSVQASADFVVDDKTIVQYNPDISNRYTWAVGGSKYTYKSTSESGKYFVESGNYNSISVEMCSCKTSKKTLNATDKDWYFTADVVNNTVDLVMYLMAKYHINADHVIMHHHRTGKICPNPWCVDENRLKYYHEFVNRVRNNPNGKVVLKCKLYKGMNEWEGVLDVFEIGTQVKIVKDIGNGWSKVQYLGKTGYVKNAALAYNNKTPLSVYPTRKATEKVVLRSDRKVSKSTKRGVIEADTLFTLLAKDDKWAYINYGGIKYYVWKAKTTVK